MLSSFPAPEPAELMEALELVSPAAWTQAFGLAEILMMKDLHQRAPMLLRNTVVSVDVMRDTSEDFLNTLTCCFSGGGGIPELGLGEAEVLCVMTAWKRALSLSTSAKSFGQTATAIYATRVALGVLATALALLYALRTSAGTCTGPPGALDLLLILATLGWWACSAVSDRLRPRRKWAVCLMASQQIVDQIYKYRMRTDKYDTQAPLPGGEEGEEPVESFPKMREMMARKDFVDTCSRIYSEALKTEVGKEDALVAGELEALDQRDQFMVLVSAHVQTELHGIGTDPTAGSEQKQDEVDPNASRAPPDDLVSPMVLETYVDARVRGTAYLVRTRAAHLASLSRGLHALGLGAFLLSAVCAALGVAMRSSLAAAVPLCVLLNWMAESVADYLYLPKQLEAANSALEDINNLLQWWDALSLLQRKTRAVKLKCVQTVEGATLAMCSARTALSAALKEEEEEEEEE